MRITSRWGIAWFCLSITLTAVVVANIIEWVLLPPAVFAYEWKINTGLCLLLAGPISLWGGMQIRQKTRVMDELRDLVNHDPMTRLLSRRRFYEMAGRDTGPGALILADIDRFKQINDSHGHATGDQVIIAVADRLRAGVRPGDLAGRLGGEEFALWLPGIALADALALAERLRHAVAQAPMARARAGPVTISAGLAQRRAGEAIPALIDRADTALYAAKTGGRNRVVLLDDDGHDAPGSADCLQAGTG